jgi:hypothetical protein
MSNRCNRALPVKRALPRALVAAACAAALMSGLIAAASAEAAGLPNVTITITPTSITVAGALQSGGVNVVTSGSGIKGEAGAVLIRLNPGVTPAEAVARFEAQKKEDINNVSELGAIVLNSEVEPGRPPSESQINLAPGPYLALANYGEHGPAKVRTSFTVAPSRAPASLPTPQAIERAIDFGFTGPRTLHVGELVGVENEGFVVHMNVALQVKNLRAAKQFVKFTLAGKERQARKLVAGAFTLQGPVSHGAYQQETITAKPGVYVQVCFMETQDKRDHTRLGMERIIRVVK